MSKIVIEKTREAELTFKFTDALLISGSGPSG